MEDEPRKPFWLRFSLILFGLVVYSVCLAAGSLMGWASRSSVLKEVATQVMQGQTAEQVFATNTLTLLILGCDEDRYYTPRGSGKAGQVIKHASRSDMMMVAKIDFRNKRITGISIPRDLRWEVPGYKPQKINAYHALGGQEGGEQKARELARRAAEGVVGVSIDRVVVLDYNAFKQMVDAIGGVEVYVPRNMDYDDNRGDLHIHLKKGMQLLDGENAMGFVRYRHGDTDFMRQDRQKDLMMAVKDRMLQKWQQTPEVVDKSIDLLGRAFKPEEIAALALFGKKLSGDNIKMGMVPTLEIPGTYDLELDADKLAAKLKELHLDPRSIGVTG